jgi:predicted small lipoprotein YifL
VGERLKTVRGAGLRFPTVLAGLLAAAGCGLQTPQQVTPAGEVTLPEAMKEIACGVKTYQNELARLHMNSGALQDTTEVTLALTASATGSHQLVVDVKPSFHGISPVDVSDTSKLENVGSRTNTIHIVFKNLYTASLNDAGKAALAQHPVPLGPGSTFYAWVDKPCDSVTDPVSVDELRQIYRRGPHG